MALLYVIRRSASRFAPVVFNRAHLHSHHHHASALFAAVSKRSSEFERNFLPTSFFHRYSTKTSSDELLLRVIDSEIKCAVESQEEDKAEELPAGFSFKIDDQPGQQTITLSREYQNENITVEVHMPDLVTGEDNTEENAGGNEEGEERANESTIPLVVRVSKKTGPVLEFGCTAFPDEIAIDNLSVKDLEISEDQIQYEGPDFTDLDENLQKAFHKYLDIRGIKPSATNFLHAYMLNKDNKEYIAWLKNLQKFVKA